jgi:hypothetical protein
MERRSSPLLCFWVAMVAALGFGRACSGSDPEPQSDPKTLPDGALPDRAMGGASGSEGSGSGGAAGSGAGGSGAQGGSGAGGSGTDGSGGTAGGGPEDANAGDARDAQPPGCDGGGAPMPTGSTIQVTPPMTIASALMGAQPGDKIVLNAGTYTAETITNRRFSNYIFIEAAAGATITIPALTFRGSDHIAIRGVRFTGTVQLDASSFFMFHETTFDRGTSGEAALHIHGQGSGGASHDVLVADSIVRGGGRTVFVLGRFAPSEQWNHHLTFVNSEFTCGANVCFQISGGRDILIENNRINGTTTSGVLTAGATRVTISRNRFLGRDGSSQAAMQIATPGMEWDNFAGVENMISSAIFIANNVIDHFATGVQLDAARDVSIVHNTVADRAGIRFNHRIPHDQQGNVILNGNSEIKVWNNILPTISLASGEMRPSFESNNQVFQSGGGGMNPVSGQPMFGTGADYPLSATSPAIDKGLVHMQGPLIDFEGRPRNSVPDVGAREYGAGAPICP